MKPIVSPKGWVKYALGELATIERKTIQPENIQTGTIYLGLEHITSEGQFTEIKSIASGELASSKFAFNDKHLLYGKLRPYLKKIARPNFSGVCSTDILPIIPGSKLDRDFLYYYLRQPSYIDLATAISTGANLPRLSPKDLAKFHIYIPSLEEQRRIAAILDKADAVRRKRQQAIALTEELLRSAFLEMFGDPITNPKGWIVKPLSSLCSVRRGGSPRPIEAYLRGSVPWIKIGDATESDDVYIYKTTEAIRPEGVKKSLYLEPGSLIFANCGVSLGFARILKIGGCIHDGWLSFSNIDESLNKIYLLKLLNSLTNHFRQIAPSGTQPNLNTSIMNKFGTPVPPMQLQVEFAKIVTNMSSSKQRQTQAMEEANNFFNSLLQRAFRGAL